MDIHISNQDELLLLFSQSDAALICKIAHLTHFDPMIELKNGVINKK